MNTEQLRAAWHRPTFQQALDELVAVPPRADALDDAVAMADLRALLGGIEPQGRVIDYGCGVGRLTRPMLQLGCEVLAVDLSPTMLVYTAQHCGQYPGLRLAETDGLGVGVGPIYDGALCCYCLQHYGRLSDVANTVWSLARALRPGGWCVLQSREESPEAWGWMAGCRQPAWRLLAIAESAGLAVESIQAPLSLADAGYVLRLRRRASE